MNSHDVTPPSKMQFLLLTQEEGLTYILSEKRLFTYIPTDEADKLLTFEVMSYDEDECFL